MSANGGKCDLSSSRVHKLSQTNKKSVEDLRKEDLSTCFSVSTQNTHRDREELQGKAAQTGGQSELLPPSTGSLL